MKEKTVSNQYDAFISYSHAADSDIAKRLQRALETFGTPFFQVRSLQLFRDETDLGANPGLWPKLTDAIGKSRFFVLLASPESAHAKWVTRELEYWLEIRPSDTILIAATRGSFAWDESVNDFDWSQTDCIPRCLAGKFENEPTAILLTNLDRLNNRNPDFRQKIAKLAAPIHGKPVRELYDRELGRFRRRLTLASAMIGALAVLLIGVLWQAIRIQSQSNHALAESLSSRARIMQDSAPTQSAVMAGTAYAVVSSTSALGQWIASVANLPEWTEDPDGGELVSLSEHGRELVVSNSTGEKRILQNPALQWSNTDGDKEKLPGFLIAGAGSCIHWDYVPVAPQGGEAEVCMVSVVEFSLRNINELDSLLSVTFEGRVRAVPGASECDRVLLLREKPFVGGYEVGSVNTEFVVKYGKPKTLEDSGDYDYEEPSVNDQANNVAWHQLGEIRQPSTSASCALVYLDETNQLQRRPIDGRNVLVSDASFGPVNSYQLSSDGHWAAMQHTNGMVVVSKIEARTDSRLAGMNWAKPLRRADGSFVAAAFLPAEGFATRLCQYELSSDLSLNCSQLLGHTPTVYGGASVRMRPDSTRSQSRDELVVTSYPGVQTCRSDAGQLSCSEQFAVLRGATKAVAISHDGTTVAVSQVDSVKLYKEVDNQWGQIFQGERFAATSLAFDGTALWMGGGDGLMYFVPESGGTLIDRTPVAELAVIAGGGKAIVEDGTGRLRLADKDRSVFDIGSLPQRATALSASVALPLVAIGQADGNVLLWDIERRAEAGRFDVGAPVKSVEFRSDDKELWVVTDGYLTIVATDPDELQQRSCGHYRLSDSDWTTLVGRVPPMDSCP